MTLVSNNITGIQRRVRRTLDDANASLSKARVLVLCSGGIDSTVLVALLARLPKGAAPRVIEVLFLDHGVRALSKAEQDAACKVATEYNLSFHVRCRSDKTVLGEINGVQADARTWRYETATQVAQELGCNVVAVGHNADDQLECLLLGLIGATTGGRVSGMKVVRELDTVKLVRPLLAISRKEIEFIAQALSIEYADDPSNANPDAYLRNAIRHRVVPELLKVSESAGVSIARFAEKSGRSEKALESLANIFVEQVTDEQGLDIRQLSTLDKNARYKVISCWLLKELAGQVDARRIDFRLIRSVDQLCLNPKNARCASISVSRDICVRRNGYYVHITLSAVKKGS